MQTHSFTVPALSAGGLNELSVSIGMTGYTAVGIVGISAASVNHLTHTYIINAARTTAVIGVKNISSSSTSQANGGITILYFKNV